MVGVRDAFYSKTKRFCSVSCSRSYSSNSKKASILARLQVTGVWEHFAFCYVRCDGLRVSVFVRESLQPRKPRFCRSSL